MSNYLVELKSIYKKYRIADQNLPVLKAIDLSIEKNEFISIMGPSGSGKSTLLNIIGTLDKPDQGEYLFKGQSMLNRNDKHLSAFRSHNVGFVFQTFNLIPSINLLENVKLPFLYSEVNKDTANIRAKSAVELVGLKQRIHHKPLEISGGEMQRCAIARAIAINPEMILADEPTGNLDSQTGNEILDLLEKLHKEGVTIIIITHDSDVASKANKSVLLTDGEIFARH